MHKCALIHAEASRVLRFCVHPLIPFHKRAPEQADRQWISMLVQVMWWMNGLQYVGPQKPVWKWGDEEKSHPYVITWTGTQTGRKLCVACRVPIHKHEPHGATDLSHRESMPWNTSVKTDLTHTTQLTMGFKMPPSPQQPILICVSLFPGSLWFSWKPWFAWTSWKEGMASTYF